MNHYIQNFKQKFFKLSAVCDDDFLNLTLFKDKTAWNVELPKNEIQKQSGDVDFKQYYAKLKNYLKFCPEDVDFDFTHGKFTINVLLKNKMKILFFTSDLKQVKFVENVFYLIDKLYNDKAQCCEKLNNFEKQQNILHEENKNLEKKIDLFLERKKHEEQQLYCRFVAVLNEKKQEIQHLNNFIAYSKGRSSISSSLKNREKNNSKSTKTARKNTKAVDEPDNSSLSDITYTIDNEANYSNTVDISLTKTNSQPSSTSQTKSKFIEDPLKFFTFSKRIRTNSGHSVSINLPEMRNTESDIKELPSCINFSKDSNDLTPVVNFSTQDLLDNLTN